MDSDLGLVGRKRELDVLHATLDGAADRSAALAVTGEPGIGKSALLGALAGAASGRGFRVLEGRAAEFDRDAPFAAFVDALDEPIGALASTVLARIGETWSAELARILPSAPGTADTTASPPDERFRSYQALRAALEAIARDRPLALIVDDCHWLDPASVEVAAHLVRRPPHGRIVFALGLRPHQAPAELMTAIADAERNRTLTRLEPEALGPEEADLLLGAELPAETRARLHRESGGNPFFLLELARAAAARSSALPPSHDGNGGIDVPRTVGEAIAMELDGLAAAERTLAHAGAVLGESFDLDLACEVAELDAEAGATALDPLLVRELIRPTPDPRRFRFRHPIVRHAIYEASSTGWRLGAHGRCAEALERRGEPAAARAPHLEVSARPGDEDAIAVLIEAGEQTAAHRLLPSGDERRIGLLISSAASLGASGALKESRDTLSEAVGALPDDQRQLKLALVPFLAQLEHLRACALAALARGDAEAAREELGRAAEALEAGGAARHHADALGQLRRIGAETEGAGGKNGAPPFGVGLLSDRERQVAELVAAGRTNAEIATELFLSKRTVESHMQRIFAKLNVPNRAAVAAAIIRADD